jgi:XTP/dITP diphosphohydrolase
MSQSQIPYSHEEPMHVVYCVDAGDRMADGSRRAAVDKAIDRALSELKSTDTFSVVAFSEEAIAFSPRLLPPLLGNIQNAVRFLMDTNLGGRSDCAAALESALHIAGVTHLYLVSPGPLAGGMAEVEALRERIRQYNDRHVKISCIAIGGHAKPEFSALMQGIASDNEGTYFQMEEQEEESLPERLLVATMNPKKRAEMVQILSAASLNIEILTLADFPGAVEVEETGETFLENAHLKARAGAALSGLISVADDGGLVIDALGGAPGVQSHRFLGADTSFDVKMDRVLEMMRDVSMGERTCRFVSAVVVATPDGRVYECERTCEGRIAHEKRGSYGFGYDPFFLLPERGQHMAELPPEEKHKISHRGKALAGIIPILRSLFTTSEGVGSPSPASTAYEPGEGSG